MNISCNFYIEENQKMRFFVSSLLKVKMPYLTSSVWTPEIFFFIDLYVSKSCKILFFFKVNVLKITNKYICESSS